MRSWQSRGSSARRSCSKVSRRGCCACSAVVRNKRMFFPISNSHISPIYLAIVGFLIGILGGFFGVGGSFIAGPALRAVGLDWNFAVGTELPHIVGKSVVAVRRHRALGNVDLRLGLIMAVGTIG